MLENIVIVNRDCLSLGLMFEKFSVSWPPIFHVPYVFLVRDNAQLVWIYCEYKNKGCGAL